MYSKYNIEFSFNIANFKSDKTHYNTKCFVYSFVSKLKKESTISIYKYVFIIYLCVHGIQNFSKTIQKFVWDTESTLVCELSPPVPTVADDRPGIKSQDPIMAV